jgi:hypothetical protein
MMAAYLADVATKYQAGGLANATLNGLIDARVKANLESYTILGSEASGSTLDIGAALPSGARVLEICIEVSANQTALTVDVGDDADADRYAAATTDLQTAGFYRYSGSNYKTGQATGDTQLVLTTGGATATAGQLEIIIYYTMD